MKHIICFLLISTALFNYGCKKEETPVEPKSFIDFTGTAYLFNENGKLSNHSGIVVTVESSGQTTTTDSLGNWSIKNVEHIRQSFSFSKSGFGTNKEVELLVTSDGEKIIRDIELHQYPTFVAQNLSLKLTSGGVTVSGTISSVSTDKYRTVVIYFGKDNLVSSSPSKWLTESTIVLYPDSSLFTNTIGFEGFLTNGFSAGSKIYAIGYTTTSLATSIMYKDVSSAKNVYSSLSIAPSNVAEVSLP